MFKCHLNGSSVSEIEKPQSFYFWWIKYQKWWGIFPQSSSRFQTWSVTFPWTQIRIMVRPFTLCLHWRRCADEMSALNLKMPTHFPPPNQSPALFFLFFFKGSALLHLSQIFPSDPTLLIFTSFLGISLCCVVSVIFPRLTAFTWSVQVFLSPLRFDLMMIRSFYILLSSMYIYGGFSGPLLNDVLAYTPPSCLAFSNPVACAAAGPGVRCHWVSGRCLPWEPKSPERIIPAAFCIKPTGTSSRGSDSSRLLTVL